MVKMRKYMLMDHFLLVNIKPVIMVVDLTHPTVSLVDQELKLMESIEG